MSRAIEGAEVVQARRSLTGELTGPLTTMATREIVDPIRTVRPDYHGPRRAPSWWDNDDADDVAGALIESMT